VVLFRFGFALWSLWFWAVRLPHVFELYCRPVLRRTHAVIHWIGAPLPPVWLAQAMIGALILLILGFAFSRRPRRFHTLLFIPLCFLYAFDPRSGGGYGGLALVVWGLLFFAPYERWHSADGGPATGPVTAQRLLMLQWASVYAFTVPSKLLDGAGWLNGEALWRALHSDHVGRFLLSEWVDIPLSACAIASLCVLAAEAFVAVGIWFGRTRMAAMVVCVALHLGMALPLRISPLFHTLMLLHLVLFLPETTWNRRR
jgi:hypothetical protein